MESYSQPMIKTKTLHKLALGLSLIAFGGLVHTSAMAVEPGYRVPDAENTIVIDTTKGRIVVEVYPQLAPKHVERLKTLVRQKFYTNHKFHRVIEGFMAQTGDPTGTGSGGSTLPNIVGEFTARRGADFPLVVASRPRGSVVGFIGAMPVQSQNDELMHLTIDNKVHTWGLYCQGVLGMARENDPNSANSQFFLMRSANPALEKRYTAFGVVISGLSVVKKLKIGEPPKDPDIMQSVQILADMPVADRPKIEVIDTQSALFKTELDKTRKRLGADFSACDVPVLSKTLP